MKSYLPGKAISLLTSKNTPRHSFSSRSKDIIFIRHARSQFNDACQNFRVRHNIPWDWQQLVRHPKFAQEVAYNKAYMDCSLTPKGIEQCLKAREKFKNEKVDIILVSPQQRALQTCKYIFSGRNRLVKVVPILNGPLWSVCDISGSFNEKITQFPEYDFSEIEKEGQLWYLKHISPSQKVTCLNQFQRRQAKTVLEKKLIILELLKQQKILESPTYLRQRSERFKKYIQKLHQSYKKIVIVSHFYKIQYALSREFSQEDEPLDKIDVPNCTPYYVSEEQLMKPTVTVGKIIV